MEDVTPAPAAPAPPLEGAMPAAAKPAALSADPRLAEWGQGIADISDTLQQQIEAIQGGARPKDILDSLVGLRARAESLRSL